MSGRPQGLRLTDRVRVVDGRAADLDAPAAALYDGPARVVPQKVSTEVIASSATVSRPSVRIALDEGAWLDKVEADRGRYEVHWVRGRGLSTVRMVDIQSVGRGAAVANIYATSRPD